MPSPLLVFRSGLPSSAREIFLLQQTEYSSWPDDAKLRRAFLNLKILELANNFGL